MKLLRYTIPLLVFSLLGAGSALAQADLDAYFGMGTALNSSNGNQIETYGDGVLYDTPSMGGPFLNFGATLMLTPHFGVGGEVFFRPDRADYAGLQYRPIFWDINGVWRPFESSGRVVPEFQAGIGGVSTRFYYTEESCNEFTGCTSYTSLVGTDKHFQGHFGAGVRLYVTPHLFVRPQFDLHLVNNFEQFGRSTVPRFGAAIGYSFSEH